MSHYLRSVWIEIFTSLRASVPFLVTLFAECVDWNIKTEIRTILESRHTLCGWCGLKLTRCRRCTRLCASPSLRGVWIEISAAQEWTHRNVCHPLCRGCGLKYFMHNYFIKEKIALRLEGIARKLVEAAMDSVFEILCPNCPARTLTLAAELPLCSMAEQIYPLCCFH